MNIHSIFLERTARTAKWPAAALFSMLVALTLLFAGPALADDDGDDAGSEDYVSDEVVVKLNPDLATGGGASIADINAAYGTTTLETVLSSKGIYLLKLPAAREPEEISESMESDTRLLYAEPNYFLEPPEGGRRHRWRGGLLDYAYSVVDYAADTLGLSGSRDGNRGDGTVVAVLDTGVQLNHRELRGSFTSARYDFVNDTRDFSDAPNSRDDDGDGHVDEMVGHGTHVAGIVNEVAPEARIMPLRVLDSDGIGNAFVIAEAVSYAADNGADVVNLSLSSPQQSEILADTIEDVAEERGVAVVAAAGNDGATTLEYPAANEEAIAVTSVGSTEQKSDFANYGLWVDVAAPGEDIESTVPINDYALSSGTSMATPFIAGQAALILSEDSSLDTECVETLIKDTARSLDASNPSYAGMLGAGHADIGASIDRIQAGGFICGDDGSDDDESAASEQFQPSTEGDDDYEEDDEEDDEDDD